MAEIKVLKCETPHPEAPRENLGEEFQHVGVDDGALAITPKQGNKSQQSAGRASCLVRLESCSTAQKAFCLPFQAVSS